MSYYVLIKNFWIKRYLFPYWHISNTFLKNRHNNICKKTLPYNYKISFITLIFHDFIRFAPIKKAKKDSLTILQTKQKILSIDEYHILRLMLCKYYFLSFYISCSISFSSILFFSFLLFAYLIRYYCKVLIIIHYIHT